MADLVRKTYSRARARGVRAEVDHWKYLITVAIWGSYFETDPQHGAVLIRAGWMDGATGATRNCHPGPVLREVDAWVIHSALDLARNEDFAEDLVRICDERVRGPALVKDLAWLLAHLWPAKFARLDEAGQTRITEEVARRMVADRIAPRSRPHFTALALLPGHGFHRDPLYPALGSCFRPDADCSPDLIRKKLQAICGPYQQYRLPP